MGIIKTSVLIFTALVASFATIVLVVGTLDAFLLWKPISPWAVVRWFTVAVVFSIYPIYCLNTEK